MALFIKCTVYKEGGLPLDIIMPLNLFDTKLGNPSIYSILHLKFLFD